MNKQFITSIIIYLSIFSYSLRAQELDTHKTNIYGNLNCSFKQSIETITEFCIYTK